MGVTVPIHGGSQAPDIAVSLGSFLFLHWRLTAFPHSFPDTRTAEWRRGPNIFHIQAQAVKFLIPQQSKQVYACKHQWIS